MRRRAISSCWRRETSQKKSGSQGARSSAGGSSRLKHPAPVHVRDRPAALVRRHRLEQRPFQHLPLRLQERRNHNLDRVRLDRALDVLRLGLRRHAHLRRRRAQGGEERKYSARGGLSWPEPPRGAVKGVLGLPRARLLAWRTSIDTSSPCWLHVYSCTRRGREQQNRNLTFSRRLSSGGNVAGSGPQGALAFPSTGFCCWSFSSSSKASFPRFIGCIPAQGRRCGRGGSEGRALARTAGTPEPLRSHVSAAGGAGRAPDTPSCSSFPAFSCRLRFASLASAIHEAPLSSCAAQTARVSRTPAHFAPALAFRAPAPCPARTSPSVKSSRAKSASESIVRDTKASPWMVQGNPAVFCARVKRSGVTSRRGGPRES